MFEKFAAIVLCAFILFGAGSIIWITWKGYNRKFSKPSGVQPMGMASGPVKSPTKKRRTKKRRGRR